MDRPARTRKENQPAGKVEKRERFPLFHRHDYEKKAPRRLTINGLLMEAATEWSGPVRIRNSASLRHPN